MPIGSSSGQQFEDDFQAVMASQSAPITDEEFVQQRKDQNTFSTDPFLKAEGPNPARAERYKTWPERAFWEIVKTATETIPDLVSGKIPASSPEGIQKVTDVALEVGSGGIATAPMRAGVGTFGGLHGAQAFKAGPKKLKDAMELSTNGATPEEIWSKTGWYRDVRDQQWKFEINDAPAKLLKRPDEGSMVKKPDEIGTFVEGGNTLKEVLDHPQLYKAYPFLKDYKIIFDPYKTDSIASHFPELRTIVMTERIQERPEKEFLSVLLHEVQHAIQRKESFGTGGTTIPRSVPENLRNTREGKLLEELEREDAMLKYVNRPGEKEARNVQLRYEQGLTRKNTLGTPHATEGRQAHEFQESSNSWTSYP